MAVIASQSTTKVIVSEDGARGEAGADGIDGAGFNNVRKSKLDNPLCHLFKTNKLVEASAPTGTDSDVNFTRTTTATYVDRYGVVQSAGVNEIREEKEGFLLEGASTNILLISQAFDSAQWAGANVTVTGSSITAPDGTLTGAKLDETSTAGKSALTQNITFNNSIYTYSVFLKKGNFATASISFTSASHAFLSAAINFDTLAITGNNSSNAQVKQLNDGWLRLSMTIPTTAGVGGGNVRIYPVNSDSPASAIGYCYAWGAQVEELPFATSYIPTTSAPVTRADDFASVAWANNMVTPDQEYTIGVNFSLLGYKTSFDRIFSNHGESFNFNTFATTNGLLLHTNGGDSNKATTNAKDLINEETSYIIKKDDSNYTSYTDGVKINTQASATPSNVSGSLFKFGTANTIAFMHISDFKIYDFAINDDEAKLIGGQ